jgi:hypothetical protein
MPRDPSTGCVDRERVRDRRRSFRDACRGLRAAPEAHLAPITAAGEIYHVEELLKLTRQISAGA